MSNQYKLVGEVHFVRKTPFVSKKNIQGVKTTFFIAHTFNNRRHYTRCKTFVPEYTQMLKDSMVVEIDNYVPTSYLLPETEELPKRDIQELHVIHLKVIGSEYSERVNGVDYISKHEFAEKLGFKKFDTSKLEHETENQKRMRMLEQQQIIINNQKPIQTETAVVVNVEEFEKDKESGHTW